MQAIGHDDALSKKPREGLRLGVDAVAISVAQATEQIRSQVPGDELALGYSALSFVLSACRQPTFAREQRGSDVA